MSSAPDELDGAPHPCQATTLVGHDAAKAAFLDSYNASRLHHAWLIGGPQGIGKATLAYQIAKFILSPHARAVLPATTLDVAMDMPSTRQILAGSHPDLVVLRRLPPSGDRKTATANIPVDLVRRALDMFSTSAASGGWRVCLIDSAEDLQGGGANALLKSLEEPPAKCLFLIVSHAPARLLPTIRSRCRNLSLAPLSQDEIITTLSGLELDAEPALIARAASVAEGSARRAIQRLDKDVLSLIDITRKRLVQLPVTSTNDLLALAESVAGRTRQVHYDVMMDVIEEWLSFHINAHAGEGAHRLAPLTQVWDKATRAAREAEIFNLDRRPLVLSLFQDLSEAVRRSRAA
jgi:DNA polymerase III subunit delta'